MTAAYNRRDYVGCPACNAQTFYIRYDSQTQEYVIECGGEGHEVRRMAFLASGPLPPPQRASDGPMILTRMERYTIEVFHEDGRLASKVEVTASTAGGAIQQTAEGNGAWTPLTELQKDERRLP